MIAPNVVFQITGDFNEEYSMHMLQERIREKDMYLHICVKTHDGFLD